MEIDSLLFVAYLSLPEVDDVVFLVVEEVGVEDHVRVSPKELAIHFGVHRCHLKVFNTPHLHVQKECVQILRS